MRKCTLFYIIFTLSIQCAFSQKRDNIWMLGTYSTYENYGIDFNVGVADTFAITRNMNFYFSNASICDTNGQVLFYSNGDYIANRLDDSLQNTQNFNPGFVTTNYQNGICIFDGLLILPKPGNANKYYIIHESAESIYIDTIVALHPLNLSFSEIDINLDGGLGGIIPGRKNVHLVDDTLTYGRVAAVKHGNGRDWWVIAHRFNSTLFYEFLVTPDSIYGPYMQNVGMFNPHLNYYGQAIFSPDGDKYCIQLDDTALNLFDFDRCTGTLSNSRVISVTDTVNGSTLLAAIGCAFSLSARYLYVSNVAKIHQFDTWSGNVPSTNEVVAQWDTFYSPGETLFDVMRLGPDGRIYISTYVGTNILHYIEYPDSGGVTCNVVQNSFVTPSYNTFSFPNSPNWDLGPSLGSGCDSLINITPEVARDKLNIVVSPNPARESFWVTYDLPVNEKGVFEIYDALGNKVKQYLLYGYSKGLLIHAENFNEGVYFYRVRIKDEMVASGKIIIIH